jgi:ankyrin repeat protein
LLEFLLDHGVDPNTSSKDKVSAMLAAAQGLSAAPTVISALLSHGAYPDVRDSNGRTPLSCAVERGDEEMIKILLESGADPNAVDDRGWSHMRTAWESNHPELIRCECE